MENRKSVIVTGGTGLIGTQLCKRLIKSGYHVYVLTRSPKETGKKLITQVFWDPMRGEIDADALPKAPMIVNLAGAPIVGKRWTERYQQLIIDSRTQSAQVLGRLIEMKNYKPECYIGASAIGIYGNSGVKPVDETVKGNPNRFIVRSVTAWEEAHQGIAELGIRTAIIRIGLVLSRKGGLVKKMLLPAMFGIYGYFGNGKQIQSWIHIDDLVEIFMQALQGDRMAGVYNGAAPKPVNAKEMANALRKAHGSGLVLPVPVIFLKLILGKAHKILLDSCHASAEKTSAVAGMSFRYPGIREAMRSVFGRAN